MRNATEPRMTENAERLSELELPSDLGRRERPVLLQSKTKPMSFDFQLRFGDLCDSATALRKMMPTQQ